MSSFRHFRIGINVDIATPSGTLIDTGSEVQIMRDKINSFIQNEYKNRLIVGRFDLSLEDLESPQDATSKHRQD